MTELAKKYHEEGKHDKQQRAEHIREMQSAKQKNPNNNQRRNQR